MVMRIDNYEVPENLCYNKDHAWVLMDEGQLVKVGITDYAQQALKEITFLYMPKKDAPIKFSEVFGRIESVKAISELYSPFTGEIVEVNEKLVKKPRIINEDPYGEGWIVMIRPSKRSEEQEKLIKPEEYADYIKGLIKIDKNLLIYKWREQPPQ